MKKDILALSLLICFAACNGSHEPAAVNDSNTPLHLLKPVYEVPYGVPTASDIKSSVDKVKVFIESATPMAMVDEDHLQQGTFRLTSYEWGVTYQAMLAAGRRMSDASYTRYATDRMRFLAEQYPHFKSMYEQKGQTDPQMRSVVHPQALDDAGAVCTAMIKAQLADSTLALLPLIENYVDYIMYHEYRLSDGTFARRRPLVDAVWLDDMFMGIPALAWYGRLEGGQPYYDEAVRQVRLFAQKMWVEEKQLFRHGWVASMAEHPSFHWARANGWAILTLTEVLDALPEDYPDRDFVLQLLQKHAYGLLQYQSSEGFWHQLIDRSDSYLETSATAIYAYCIAHGICEGWLDALVCGPSVLLAWNAVSTKITADGQVEGTCVGTGMGFDPAFYYYRPVHALAAHGYGPVIMAGAEVCRLLECFHPQMNDSAVQFYTEDYSDKGPIFSLP